MNLETRKIRGLFTVVVLFSLHGCATWSTSSVDAADPRTPVASTQMTSPDKVLISENDVSERKYTSLGDVTVTVNKTTIFHADPTKEMVDQKLKEEAAKLGADAVIFVRYGTIGVSLMSWGSLEGKGRAIKFSQ